MYSCDVEGKTLEKRPMPSMWIPTNVTFMQADLIARAGNISLNIHLQMACCITYKLYIACTIQVEKFKFFP